MKRFKFLAHAVFDLMIFSSLCLTEWALRKWLRPYKRGFFCDDDSLRYPYRENTVSVRALIAIALAVPGIVIASVELFKKNVTTTATITAFSGSEKRKAHLHPHPHPHHQHQHKGCQIGQRLLNCYKQIGYFLFGLALTLITTSITKYSVGRLRPFFFAICQPQMANGTTCLDSINHDRYIEDYECLAQNVTTLAIQQLRQSFPSGHTSILFYAMIYLSIYIQVSLSTKASKLFKHLLQFIFIMLAWYVALTRISDYWHHWSDVLAGAILGTMIAFAVALNISRLYQRGSSSSSSAASSAAAYSTTSTSSTSSTSLPAYQRSNIGNGNASNGKGGAATKPAISPSSSTSTKSPNNASPILPAYTFGTLPYMTHPQAALAAATAAAAAQQHAAHYAAAAQTYHNYGYVP